MRNDYLFLDIETIPSSEKPDYPPFKVSGNATKAETIQKQKDAYEENKEALRDAEWKKTSLKPLEGRILCIGYAINKEETHVLTGTEKEILEDLSDILIENDITRVVAHNGLGFDYPFIYLRAVKHKVFNVINTFNGSKRDMLYDTMKMAAGTEYKAYYSLDALSKLIGGKGKGDIDGSMIADMWLKGELSEIYNYCKEDVDNLRDVFFALKGE